jgi:hypothetical protein
VLARLVLDGPPLKEFTVLKRACSEAEYRLAAVANWAGARLLSTFCSTN